MVLNMQARTVQLILVPALAFLAGFALSTGSGASPPAPDPMEAATAAPKNHKVLYEDDHVRLIEVTVQPGETENLHIHHFPSVFIYDATQPRIRNRLANGTEWEYGRNFQMVKKSMEGVKLPPEVLAAMTHRESELPKAIAKGWPAAMTMGPDSGVAHQVTDIDTFPHHFYRFEFKRLEGNEIVKRTKY